MANFITISRIILAFVALGMLFYKTEYYEASLVLTIFVMWFDGLDGYVARKFNETSKLGAVLDIMGDRMVENLYWLVFCALGWINVIIPAIVVSRGIITDALRSLALSQGYTAFGANTMQQNPIAKFIVASNFSRFTYAVVKAMAFVLIIAGHLSPYKHEDVVLNIGIICAIVATVFCVVRGLPVIFESKRFFTDDNK
ncbi:MAG: CDP-alcohol phosphatidyltransferase family protein [Cyanobacteria bacterium SIG30]|nr:CDP-alcohol phosphatidyltransferase family protein [Cyanobacteria bacterium SIG30]